MSKRESFKLRNGKVLSYARYGNPEGYPVLVMHGMGGSIVADGLDESLKDSPLDLIYLARPGYGESEFFEMERVCDWAALLLEFFRELNIGQFDVLAYSAGAPYAYSLGYLYPEQVGHIFINGGLPALYRPEILRLFAPDAEETHRFYQTGSYEEVGRALYDMFFGKVSKKFLNSVFVQDSIVDGCRGMVREAKLQAVDWGFAVEDVTSPMTVVHCKRDRQVSFASVEKTVELLRQCTFVPLESGGHCDEPSMEMIMQMVVKYRG